MRLWGGAAGHRAATSRRWASPGRSATGGAKGRGLAIWGLRTATLGRWRGPSSSTSRRWASPGRSATGGARVITLAIWGIAYSDLGEVRRAIDFYEQALGIAREIGDRRGEGNDLGNLGNRYAALGQVARAIEYYEQALAIAKEIGDRRGEGAHLGNLGNSICRTWGGGARHRVLRAGAGHRQGDRRPIRRSLNLRYLADALLDQAKLNEAISLYREALRIADEIQNRQAQSEASYGLALAQLVAGDLAAAAQTIAVARQHDYPPNNANVLALQGVIQLRLGQPAAAQAAFAAAVAQANGLLAQTPQNYAALQTLGLAEAGLALCAAGEETAEQTPSCLRETRCLRLSPPTAPPGPSRPRRGLSSGRCGSSMRWRWRMRRGCWRRCGRRHLKMSPGLYLRMRTPRYRNA